MLPTKSLDYEDLTNTQKTKASSYSLSLSGSVDPSKGLAPAPSTSVAGQAASNLLANLGGQQGLPESGSERSQTLAVISPATITLTGTDAASQQAATTLTGRDPKTANQALTNTLTLQDAARVERKLREAQQNAQAASLIGQVAAGMIGDLAAAMQKPLRDAELRQTLDAKQAKGEALSNVDRYELARLDKEGMSSAQAAQTLKDPAALANAANWQEGSANKILLHGLAGVITAKVGNGSVLVGAATGAVNEAVIPAMSDYLKSQGITPEKNLEEYKGYMQLGSALLGAGLGAIADGKNGAALGATVAHNATTYNHLKHPQITAKLKELGQCKSAPNPATCAGDVERRYNAISRENTDRLTNCKTADECRKAVAELDADRAQMQSRRDDLDRRLYTLDAAERRELRLLNDNIDNALGGRVTISATEERLLQRLASVVGPQNLTAEESERMLRSALMAGGATAGAAALAQGKPRGSAGTVKQGAGETGTKGGVSNLTESGTLQNLRPGDAVFAQRPVRTLVQDDSGRYWLQSPSGNRISPSGSYDFVTMPDRTIRVARSNSNPEFSTHLGLSGGSDVSYAGSIRFGNNTGPNRGTITNWTNNSGHYQPPTSLNKNAGLPIDLFNSH